MLDAVAREREVTLTTHGRRSGKPVSVTIWASTDGKRIFIRSGAGLGRHWPQNFLAGGRATLALAGLKVEVRPRHVSDPDEARAVAHIIRSKYGNLVKPSNQGEQPTPGEQATFELLPV